MTSSGRTTDASESASQPVVAESPRQVPLLHEVDVVVVGGSSGAVTAAVAAAENGASVFLAAPRSYLGEDICGTYRLWLEPNEQPESPLARAMFAEPTMARRLVNAIPFKYEVDVESAPPHKDSRPPSVLSDGKWQSAPSQSVQYNGDVSVVADAGSPQHIEKAHLLVYQRNDDFEVADVTVSVSDDKEQWDRVAVVANDKLGEGSFEDTAIPLTATVDARVRYIRFAVRKTPEVERVLLGEIILETDRSDSEEPAHRVPPTPMQVKSALDDALLEAGVKFLYGCYATELLRDGAGRPAGIIMANRSGRQAVKAKVVIDATPRATVARMAGAEFEPYPVGWQTFKRIVVNGKPRTRRLMKAREMPSPICDHRGRTYPAVEFTLTIRMEDGSFASFAEAEQIARDMTWSPSQVDASEMLWQVPPDRMRGEAQECCVWPGAEKIDLGIFRPQGISRLYILGGCADLPRQAAGEMLRPLAFMNVGQRIGRAAAVEAQKADSPRRLRLAARKGRPVTSGDVREDWSWMRIGAETATLQTDGQMVPVLGEYDVVVVGGGTAGAPAGIAAGRKGARTLVVEYLHGLGGVGTLGLIGKYYHGYREGFTKEIDQGLAQLGGEAEGNSGRGQAWNSQLKSEWYRHAMRKAGTDLWYGTLGCGAFIEGDRVKGVVVATPQGRGVILADVVIDSTGSGSIAAAAGGECIYTGGEHVAVQGTGLPHWDLGARYTNTDYTFIDDIDVYDAWRSFLVGRKKYQDRYDLAQIIDTRERRQILGDFFLSPMDVYLDRTYPDSVVRANSNFDSHGFTIHPMFMLRPPDRKSVPCYVPYRSLLPKGLKGIFVTGLGVSAHRDVMPVIRMQPDVQNQGYAVGLAAAMAVRADKDLREIDIRELQRHLVEKGNLPEAVLEHEDSFPPSDQQVAEAVRTLPDDWEGIEIIFVEPEKALPLLREAYRDATSSEDKLIYAHTLGILGDPTGVKTLVEAVESSEWDKGWRYTGMGQYGRSISPVDGYIIALGRTQRDEAVEPILAMVEQLGPEHEMSHHRAVAMALETLDEPAAAEPLAQLLQKPGMRGHAYTDIDKALDNIKASSVDTSTREVSLRELVLARALYRCGDHDGLGESILRAYAQDLRGHYARHALAVLNESHDH